jgi:hypothetical protein
MSSLDDFVLGKEQKAKEGQAAQGSWEEKGACHRIGVPQ